MNNTLLRGKQSEHSLATLTAVLLDLEDMCKFGDPESEQRFLEETLPKVTARRIPADVWGACSLLFENAQTADSHPESLHDSADRLRQLQSIAELAHPGEI